MNLGDYENYGTAALYQPWKICESCFELYKALEELRETEQQMAWRLGIIKDLNVPIMIPEGKLWNKVDGNENEVIRAKKSVRQNDDHRRTNTQEQNEWKLYKEQKQFSEVIDPSREIQLGILTRYRFLLVLDKIAEMSPEFKTAKKLTLVCSFFGFEERFVLESSLLLEDYSFIPINKVRLHYFFTNSVSFVKKLLKNKAVIFFIKL